MKICTIGSGSSGNCVVIQQDEQVLLIDAGISARRICSGLNELNCSISQVSAILITHAHHDHVSGLRVLQKKKNCPIYLPEGISPSELNMTEDSDFHWFSPGDSIPVGPFQIQSAKTSHDTAVSVAYRVNFRGRSVAMVTDLGIYTEEIHGLVKQSDLLILESNYDDDMLERGPYPFALKRRIGSNKGHLSNLDCAIAVERAVHDGTKKVLLAHLSDKNNRPDIARKTVTERLEKKGLEKDVQISVAPRAEISEVIEI